MSSQLLFAIGGGGIALFLVIGVVSLIVLRRKRKQIEAQIHSEYNDAAV